MYRAALSSSGTTPPAMSSTGVAGAAATADRVLFLADGRVVADLDHPTEDEILAALR